VTVVLYFLISAALASPESPTLTAKPRPAANAKQAAESAKKTIARNPRLAGTVATSLGEPIYASRLVTTSSALARSRPGVTVWRGWLVGLDGHPVRGQYARLPDGRLVDMSFEIQLEYNAQHGIPRPRKTKAELEAYRRRLERDWDKEIARREKGDEKITAEQIYLWRRMDRPWGAPFRNFIEDRARYGDPSLGQ
jgi:hypothetical protein